MEQVEVNQEIDILVHIYPWNYINDFLLASVNSDTVSDHWVHLWCRSTKVLIKMTLCFVASFLRPT